jgi:hypothetical protein
MSVFARLTGVLSDCLCSGLEKREGSTSHAFDRELPSTPFNRNYVCLVFAGCKANVDGTSALHARRAHCFSASTLDLDLSARAGNPRLRCI